MPHELFLSHDSRDKEKSEVLAQTITRATLGQIVVWHSSDATATGGLRPGNVWLDEIRRRLASSKAVVVLLTPISLSRPWLLFESGFGAAQPSCDVIPVCIGVDSGTDVPFPLAMYQAYQLSDYDSLKRFAAKLFANYDIKFDEQMCRPVLEECVQKLAQSNEESLAPKKRPEPTLSDAIFELKEHLDIRLFSLLGSTSYTGPTVGLGGTTSKSIYVVIRMLLSCILRSATTPPCRTCWTTSTICSAARLGRGRIWRSGCCGTHPLSSTSSYERSNPVFLLGPSSSRAAGGR